MRSDAFGALSRLGQVSGAASGGGEVSPRLALPVAGDPSGMPSLQSVNAALPAGGSDPSLLLGSLPPELQGQLLGMLMGGGLGGGMGAGSAGGMGSEMDGDLYRALGQRLVQILLNGGLEKLLGMKTATGG